MNVATESDVAEAMCDVLIIDDESTLREIIKEGLEIMPGFRVSTVGDAESGLARIQSRNPEVLLLDIALPGMDGFELLGMLSPFGRVDRPLTRARAHAHGGGYECPYGP